MRNVSISIEKCVFRYGKWLPCEKIELEYWKHEKTASFYTNNFFRIHLWINKKHWQNQNKYINIF